MNRIVSSLKIKKRQIFIFFSGFAMASLIIMSFLIINLFKEKNLEIENMQIENQKNMPKYESQEQIIEKEKSTIKKDSKYDNQINTKDTFSNVKDEEDIIEYFNEQERYITSTSEDKDTICKKIKNNINTIYNFLFNDGVIYGKTFSELSSSAKLKVLSITLSIDQKIDSYFPNYKDKIKEDANNLKSKIVVKYLEITNKICTNHEDICNVAREDFKTMKNSFKISFSMIKDFVKAGSSAIKEWYINTK